MDFSAENSNFTPKFFPPSVSLGPFLSPQMTTKKKKLKKIFQENSSLSTDLTQSFQNGVVGKIMKKMGWSPGKGIGKLENGIRQPILVDRQPENRGLGFFYSQNVYKNVNKSGKENEKKKRIRGEFSLEDSKEFVGKKLRYGENSWCGIVPILFVTGGVLQ